MNKKAQIDFDVDTFYEPAYWIIVGLAIVGLAIGFGVAGSYSTEKTGIPLLIKIFLLVAVFPIAYIIVKVVGR